MEFYVQKDGQQYGPIPTLQKDLLHLSAIPQHALSFLRNAGLVLMAFVLASCGKSPSDIQAEGDKLTAKIVAETTALGEELKAEKERLQAEHEKAMLNRVDADQKEAISKEAKKAEDEHRRRMQELDRKIASERQKAKSLNDQKEREEKRRLEKLAKAKEQEEKDRIQAAKLADEQADRQRIAKQVFTSIPLEPQVTLSPSLSATGTEVEVKGEALQVLKDLYRKGDWLGVYNYADKSSVTALPAPVFINSAARDLGQIQISLFLKTSYLRQDDQELMMYALRKHSPGHFLSTFTMAYNAKKHPDGTGYIFPWKFDHHHVFIILGDRQTSSALRTLERAYEDEVRQLETRLRLTEISKAEFDAAIERLDSELPKKIAQWVLKGSNN